ncbi:MAG: hypothetical protein A2V84_10845 [Chloroflexi bacterium RBG_16_70_13]|nr:MAG: hypothetical protein A2V84_10845 [Chloroflexi bacterium RBG_16_70_13]
MRHRESDSAEAMEVYEAVNGLTPAQLEIGLFWSDDPGQTATPLGHSASILGQVLRVEDRSLADAAVAYARLGLAVCDAFIACWRVKYVRNIVRPIGYIEEHVDPTWGDPLPLATPPFPEYASGLSVQSVAAAEVLTATFGATAFTDHTHDGAWEPPWQPCRCADEGSTCHPRACGPGQRPRRSPWAPSCPAAGYAVMTTFARALPVPT